MSTDNREYPKVLILNSSLDNSSGLGITLSNLFIKWPKDHIAVCCINAINSNNAKSKTLFFGGSRNSNRASVLKNKSLKHTLISWLKKGYSKLGIYEFCYKPFVPIEDIDFAKNFNPDIVFSCLGDLNRIKLCDYMMTILPNAKLVLYIVDDWIISKPNNRLFSSYWRSKYDLSFRRLIKKASGCLSICQMMSDEYFKRYKTVFYPYHNPVNTKKWSDNNLSKKYSCGIMSIIYVGKINNDTVECIKDMIDTVEQINDSTHRFVFDIYTPNYSSYLYLCTNKKYSNIIPAVNHDDIHKVIKSYKALFLPLGFSKKSREYTKFSMPTKISEYLASGLPILLYCPSEIALAKYLIGNNCVIPCTNKGVKPLKEKAMMLFNNDSNSKIVKRSLELSITHDIDKVCNSFRKRLCSF